MGIVIESLSNSLVITMFVFTMMTLVDYLNILTGRRMGKVVQGGRLRQYVIASFLGATPGCLGAFANVSFYMHGLISFGAIVGGMVATSGDESFVMLILFPSKAVMLFAILFGLGVIIAWITDKIAPTLRIRPHHECQFPQVHTDEICFCFDKGDMLLHFLKLSLARFVLIVLVAIFLYGSASGKIGPDTWNWERISFIALLSLLFFILITVPEHYLEEHIWNHIAKKHLWRIFLWCFFTILVVDVGFRYWDLETFVRNHMMWVLLIASLIGIIPESGPHLLFTVMFAKGIIPFSVLLASSIVQDGHGMLPLLSYTIRDSILVKLFNLTFGLVVGFLLYFVGI